DPGNRVVVVEHHRGHGGVAVLAGVVDQHVEPAGAVLDRPDQRLDVGGLGEVGAQGEGALELAGHRLRRGLTAAVVDHDAEALGGERPAARRADPGPAARHERHHCVAAHRYPSLALTDILRSRSRIPFARAHRYPSLPLTRAALPERWPTPRSRRGRGRGTGPLEPHGARRSVGHRPARWRPRWPAWRRRPGTWRT